MNIIKMFEIKHGKDIAHIILALTLAIVTIDNVIAMKSFFESNGYYAMIISLLTFSLYLAMIKWLVELK